MLPPTPSSQSQERPGLFGRIGNFFGAGDPNAGTPTDPFANLSRAQRTMLGFAALRDAAASLEGRDSSFFNEALGGFESARERERLREQGIFQNQVGALQALAQIEQQIAVAQEFGLPVSPAMMQMRDMLTSSVAQGGGMPAGGAVPTMQAPGDFTGGVAPTSGLTTAQGAIPGDQYLSEMERTGQIGVDAQGNLMPEAEVVQTGGVLGQPATAAELAAQREQLSQDLRRRVGLGLETGDVEFLLSENAAAMEALQQSQAYPAEAVSSARREFMGLPVVRSFADQTSAFGRVVASAEDPSPAGDLSLIFNYMKVLDPGSVVREGEFATAQNSGGVDQRVRSLYNRLLEGERLTPDQREDFLDRASRLYGQAEDQYNSLAEQYRGFAEAAGLPVEQVIPDLGFTGQMPPRRTPPAPVPEGVDPAVWASMTDEERQAFMEAGQ